jgi:gas vesicle protein
MRHYHMNAKEFIVGATIGSLLGSVTALLIAPKSGRGLRKDICNAYCNVSDKTHDLANKGKSLAKNVGCQTCDWASKARSAVEGAKKSIKGWVSEEEEIEEEETTRDLLIGGLAGGILGAVVGLLMAPKPGEELRQDIIDTYEDVSDRTHEFANGVTKKGKAFAKTASKKANKWLDIAHELVDDLTENAQDTGEDIFDKAKDLIQNNRLHDVMDWASLGVRLWKGVKSRR